jgi:hypothetical protein
MAEGQMGLKLRSDHEFLLEVSGWPVARPIPSLTPIPIGPAAYGMFQPREDEFVCEYGQEIHRSKLAMPIILRMQAAY